MSETVKARNRNTMKKQDQKPKELDLYPQCVGGVNYI